MSFLTIFSYIFLFLGAIDSSYKIISKTTMMILVSSIFGSFFVYNLFFTDLFLLEYSFLYMLAPLLFFSETLMLRKQIFMTSTFLILILYLLQNASGYGFYYFLILIEAAGILDLIKGKEKKESILVFISHSAFRILLISLMTLSILFQENEYSISFQIIGLFCLFFIYIFMNYGVSSYQIFKKKLVNLFLFKSIFNFFIPLLLLKNVNSLSKNIRFDVFEKYQNLLGIFLFLSLLFILVEKIKLKSFKEVTISDGYLVSMIPIYLFLFNSIIKFEILCSYIFLNVLLHELLKYKWHKALDIFLKNLYYLSPLNPFFYYFIGKIEDSSVTIYGKIALSCCILLSTISLAFKSRRSTERLFSKETPYKVYLFSLLTLVVLYIYEKI